MAVKVYIHACRNGTGAQKMAVNAVTLLQRHLKSVHGKCENKGRFTCDVEACGERFYHAKRPMQHYQDKHNITTSKQSSYTIHI